jgi:hypothetical protein
MPAARLALDLLTAKEQSRSHQQASHIRRLGSVVAGESTKHVLLPLMNFSHVVHPIRHE